MIEELGNLVAEPLSIEDDRSCCLVFTLSSRLSSRNYRNSFSSCHDFCLRAHDFDFANRYFRDADAGKTLLGHRKLTEREQQGVEEQIEEDTYPIVSSIGDVYVAKKNGSRKSSC